MIRSIALIALLLLALVFGVFYLPQRESQARYQGLRECLLRAQAEGFQIREGALPASFEEALSTERSSSKSAFPVLSRQQDELRIELRPKPGLIYPFEARKNVHRAWGDLEIRITGRVSRFLQADFLQAGGPGAPPRNTTYQASWTTFATGHQILANGYPIQQSFSREVVAALEALPQTSSKLPWSGNFRFLQFPTEYQSDLVLEQKTANSKTLLACIVGMLPAYRALTQVSTPEALANQKIQRDATIQRYRHGSRPVPKRRPVPPEMLKRMDRARSRVDGGPTRTVLRYREQTENEKFNQNDGPRTSEAAGVAPVQIEGTLRTNRDLDTDCYSILLSESGEQVFWYQAPSSGPALLLAVLGESSGRPLATGTVKPGEKLTFRTPGPGRIVAQVTKLDLTSEEATRGVAYQLEVGPSGD